LLLRFPAADPTPTRRVEISRITLVARLALITLLLAATSVAQTAPDPADTLVRARAGIAATLRQLSQYTCVQTIRRSYLTHETAPSSCDQAAVDKKKGRNPLRLNVTDRVRLNVALGPGVEIHSWPGADRFETGEIDELVNRGPVATGSFGGYLVDIFDNDGVEFSVAG
jgi:hypothetical protein